MIVEVEWEDASFREALLTPEAARLDEPYLCKTVGWLVAKDKHRIRLAMHQINDGRVRDLMVIPMALVRRVRRLRGGF